MIAGKTHSEILAMTRKGRCRWYKRIPPEEKEEAMKLVKIEMRAKLCALWTPERRAEASEAWTGENNPMKRPDVRIKFSGENSPAKRSEVRAKKREAWTPEKRDRQRENNKGENNPFFGETHTESFKAEQTVAKIEQWKDPLYRGKHTGKNHHNWRGGTSFEPHGAEFNAELKRQIRERDNHTCQECQYTEEELGQSLDVHHIDYDKNNNSPENLISLCRSCHSQTNFGREDWTEYFGRIIGG